MKKLNNKGLTLAELIVSFALVSVAMLYFYQTVSTVSKLYKNSKKETNDFAETTYLLRLVDAKLDDLKQQPDYRSVSGKNINLTTAAREELKKFCNEKLKATCDVSGPVTTEGAQDYHYYKIRIKKGGITKYLYRRASIKVPIGSVVEQWEVNAKTEKKLGKNEMINSPNGGDRFVKIISGNIDCKNQNYECELTNTSTIQYKRRNFREELLHEDNSTIFTRALVNKKYIWRAFRPCSNVTIVNQNDAKKTYFGTYTASNCSTDVVRVPDLKVGDVIVSVYPGKNSQNKFECQGVIENYPDKCPNEDNKLLRKVDLNWLKPNNKEYTGSPYKWVVIKKTIKDGKLPTSDSVWIHHAKYKIAADTYGEYTKTYTAFKIED